MNKIKVYSFTLYLLTALTLYYSDLSVVKNTVVAKVELARERQQKELEYESQHALPTLPNEGIIKMHHVLVSGNAFTLPAYLSQSSVGGSESSLPLRRPQCRGSPSTRAP